MDDVPPFSGHSHTIISMPSCKKAHVPGRLEEDASIVSWTPVGAPFHTYSVACGNTEGPAPSAALPAAAMMRSVGRRRWNKG